MVIIINQEVAKGMADYLHAGNDVNHGGRGAGFESRSLPLSTCLLF